MASTDRRRPRPLIELLEQEPYRFDLRQAVALLERQSPGSVPVGLRSDPAREAVWLRGSFATEFPASEVERFEPLAELGSTRPALTYAGFALGGAFGPLPPPLTALVVQRMRQRDAASRDFLDLFNHRLLSMLVRLWRQFRPSLQPGAPEDGYFASYLFAVLGLGTDGLRRTMGRHPHDRLPGLQRSLLGAAGLLNIRPASLHAVERLLSAQFGVPVRGVPLQGRWLMLDPEQRTAIGASGRNRSLGESASLGGRVWDQQAGIALELGPMPVVDLDRFLPGGAAHGPLAQLLALTLGDDFVITLRMVVRAGQALRRPLGRAGNMRLNWTSWLATAPNAQAVVSTVRLDASGERPR